MKSWILFSLCWLGLVQLPQLLSFELPDRALDFRKCYIHHLCKCGRNSKSYHHLKNCYDKLGDKSKKASAAGWMESGVGGGKNISYADVASYRDFICPLSHSDLEKGFAGARKKLRINLNELEGLLDLSEIKLYGEYELCIEPAMKYCVDHPGGCMRRH